MRAIWLALYKVLCASPRKRRLCSLRTRKCRTYAAHADGVAIYVWEAMPTELNGLEYELSESRDRADAAMREIGIAGHRGSPPDDPKPAA